MKQPFNKFRYTITDILGSVIVGPYGESTYQLEWILTDEGKLDYSKALPSKIIFKGAAFSRLLSIENTGSRCGFFYIEIERECGGIWEVWQSGRFLLNDAFWDLYRCEVEVKLDRYEDDGCLEDNQNTELNLLEAVTAPRETVELYNGDIAIEKITYSSQTTSNSCTAAHVWGGGGTPEAGGWVPYYHYYSKYFDTVMGLPVPKCTKETRWTRQTLTLPDTDPSPGAEWILLSTGGGVKVYAKPSILFDCVEDNAPASGNVAYSYKKECKILGDGGSVSSIDNGMKLADCLQAFLDEFCPGSTVKSDFYQINPDVVTNVNYVTGQASKVRNIIVFQKSDVKRPNVSGNATIANISFSRFISSLVEMHNIRWRMTGNVLRLEHVSWFSKNQGFNLTLPQYAKWVRGLVRYSYKSEEIPAKEEFSFMEASAGDFAGLPILYTGGCVSEAGRKNVKTHAVELVTTDVELCLNNPSARDSIVDDKGFVFIAADDTNKILSEPPILSASTRLNNTLAWAQLHRDYHRHYRALKSGIMNGAPTAFFSVRPLKKGVPLSVPLCCDDVFNPDDVVTTALGQGTVEKAVYNFKSNLLTLDLLYPADEDLYIAPIANNDVFEVQADETTALNVIANDVPSPQGGPITALEIVTPPSHGTADIIAGPQINYTPAPGYYGDDNFIYRASDAAAIPSNNALVALTVQSSIFVRLVKTNEQTEPVDILCGEPPEPSIGGERKTADFRLLFFADPAGTVPINTTGMGLMINLEKSEVVGDPGNAPTITQDQEAAAGTMLEFLTDYEFYRNQTDCANNIDVYYSFEVILKPGPYTII